MRSAFYIGNLAVKIVILFVAKPEPKKTILAKNVVTA
jgi:hypothetical protein